MTTRSDDPAAHIAAFARTFGVTPRRCYRAPGRVNLIGEHTDYNQGWVMPAAIPLYAWAAIAPRRDRRLVLRSAQYRGTVAMDLDYASIGPFRRRHWSRALLGIAVLLERGGHRLPGLDLLLDSEIPIGAGLSSSAAVEVVLALALCAEAGLTLHATAVAQLCMQASHEFAGARCGIMDFYIACHARAEEVLVLDTRDFSAGWLPFPSAAALLVCDTGVRHHHASGEYNSRRAECDAAVRALATKIPGLNSLRDLTLAELGHAGTALNSAQFARCRHVIGENLRVGAAAAALQRQDFVALGRLLDASHISLRDDYEVSCPQLDRMTELCHRHQAVYGARMMGGGFGGCVLALVQPAALRELPSALAQSYFAATGIKPAFWVVRPVAAAQLVECNANRTSKSSPSPL